LGLKIEPVHTVGAGDTFCGYFAAGLDKRLNFETALKRAAVAGSLACMKAGAQPPFRLHRKSMRGCDGKSAAMPEMVRSVDVSKSKISFPQI
jgi:hypothetical protein